MSIFCILFIAYAFPTKSGSDWFFQESLLWCVVQCHTALHCIVWSLLLPSAELMPFSTCWFFQWITWFCNFCGILISLVFYFMFLAWRWCLTTWYLMQLFSSFFWELLCMQQVFIKDLLHTEWSISLYTTTLSHVAPKLALQLQIQVFSLEPSTNIRNLGEQRLNKEVT